MHFELYQDTRKEWRWRLKASNGRTVADSGEGYVNSSHAREMIEKILALDHNTLILTMPS